MKHTVVYTILISIFLLVGKAEIAWGETYTFYINKGNVRLTDTDCSGYDVSGTKVEFTHAEENIYVIRGTTTAYNVVVGASSKRVAKNFIINLNNLEIKKESGVAFSVYNKDNSIVAVILKNNSKNILYSGEGRAGLEKTGGTSSDGTLLVTCEAGYTAWKADHTKGHTNGKHNESACTATCGSLDARSGNSWDGTTAADTYKAGAGIGTRGKGNINASSTTDDDDDVNNSLINLTIAGGNIQAMGAWGTAQSNEITGTAGGGASIGTGSADSQTYTAGKIEGLNITGGNIIAYRVDNSAACIGGGYRSGYVTMNIYGGTIDATKNATLSTTHPDDFIRMRAPGIGGGGGGTNTSSPAGATVNIYNGKISAYGQYGAAIGSGSGGNTGVGTDAIVYIENGHITATTEKGGYEGSGAAIGSGGSTGKGHAGNATITIKGGTIIAESELGADIGGGGTTSTEEEGYGGKGIVTISGGDITANTGGIGGGRANAGVGGDSKITVNGNADIKCNSIGGGTSLLNTGGSVELHISAGKLTVAEYIGGGIGGKKKDLLGHAKAYVSGTADVSGRFLMRASATGDNCIFDMTNGKVTSPITEQPGGAVYMIDPNGVATMSGGEIYNSKGTKGGAIYMSGGSFTISGNAKIRNNTATQSGGAVYLDGNGALFTMTGGSVSSNTSTHDGAGVYVAKGSVNICGGDISNNEAIGNGGGCYVGASGTDGYNVTIGAGVKVQGNTANNGGGIYCQGGKVKISEGSIESNTAKNGGGGICLMNGTIDIEGGTIQSNTSALYGGGLYVKNENTSGNALLASFSGGDIKKNVAKYGGGVTVDGNIELTINEVTLSENEASNGGGICLIHGAKMNFGEGMINYNQAISQSENSYSNRSAYKEKIEDLEGMGGGIYLDSNTKLTFTSADKLGLYDNIASNGADDIFANGDGTCISDGKTEGTLPDVDKMNLIGLKIAGKPFWVKDYIKGDTGHKDYAPEGTGDEDYAHDGYIRYRTAIVNSQGVSKIESDGLAGAGSKYICLAVGRDIVYITIERAGLAPGESAIFTIHEVKNDVADEAVYQTVLLTGTNNGNNATKIVALSTGTWLIKENSWNWAYNKQNDYIQKPIAAKIDNTFKFEGDKETKLLHDEDIEENKMNVN